VDDLASALLDAQDDGDLPGLLIGARQKSQDYAGGLYVDLAELCKQLRGRLNGSGSDVKEPIRAACQGVLDALAEGSSDSLILKKFSAETRSNRVSMYFP
jgi:hypothetical protein